MKAVVPYPTVVGDVTFRVGSVRMDGVPVPLETISTEHKVVALHDVLRRHWEEVRLEVRAELPEKEVAAGPWSDIVCVAVLAEGATNSRVVRRLRTEGDGGRSASVPLQRGAFRSRATLSVAVVATVDGVPGRIIGTSTENWTVDLSAKEPVLRRGPDVREVDFRTGEEWLRPYKDAPWLVEVAGERPTVHLNTAFEGITGLLGPGGGPLERAVRDTVAAEVAVDAWTAMFHAAVSELELGDDGAPEWPEGWRDWALRSLLPDIFPDLSPGDALAEVHARRTNGAGWDELQSRVQFAVARRARVFRRVGSLIRELDRSSQEALP
ncbi:hypothetical protein [Streptomyces sp. enrichment culture]|uniref:hypothetical protein n=1 Tax=Streptomyces sp. enrichment culture TaxID=1795815 RepID=UPI003F563881